MAEKLNITVDISGMTIGDLEKVDKTSRGELGISEMIEVLAKVVVEDVRAMPISALADIAAAINVEVQRAANPEEAGGN